MMDSRTSRRLIVWATAGFVMLQVGWVLLMAPYAGIDEHDHAFRASSVAAGHLGVARSGLPPELGRGDLIAVRKDVVAAAEPACRNLPYTRYYDCHPAEHLGGNEVLVSSGAARYNPVFYFIAGLSAVPFHGNAAVYAMRAVSVVISAALFALSVGLTLQWAKTRWPVVALVLAAMPTTMYSTSLASPNGIEMMSGLALWAAVLHRIKARDSGLLGYFVIGVSAALLVNLHTLGSLWFLLILSGAACLIGVRRFFATFRPRSGGEVAILVGTGLACAFEVVWVLVARTNVPSGPAVIHHSVWRFLPREMLLWPLQAIGAFPMRDEPAPLLTYAAAILVLGYTAVVAARASRATPNLVRTFALVIAFSYLVPMALTVASFPRLGLNWQGRYGMPFTVGLVLLMGLALDRPPKEPRSILLNLGLLVWVMADVIGQLSVLRQQNSDSLLATTGWWPPPTALIVALGICVWAAWQRALLGGRALALDAGDAADLSLLDEPNERRSSALEAGR